MGCDTVSCYGKSDNTQGYYIRQDTERSFCHCRYDFLSLLKVIAPCVAPVGKSEVLAWKVLSRGVLLNQGGKGQLSRRVLWTEA